MNALTEKEALLMKDIEKWGKMSEVEKQTRKQSAEFADIDKTRASIQAAKEELERCFYNDIEKEGIDMALINLHLKSTRDSILKNIPESREEYNYLNENYEKILDKIAKIYINDAKARKKRDELIEQKKIELLQKKIEEKDQKAYNRQVVVVIVCCLIFGIFIAPLIVEHPFIFMLICFIGSVIVSIINAIYIYFKKNLGD